MGKDEEWPPGDDIVRGPAQRQGHAGVQLDRLSWDSLRLLLAIAESGSFRAAASVAGVALNTLRAKVDRLERQFGAPLLRRSVEGVTLTQEGYEVVSIARQMRMIGASAQRVRDAAAQPRPGVVRIAATEGLGTYWIMPRLVEFRSRHAAARIEITCDMAPSDVLFRDIDIAVQLFRPANPDLVVERLGSMHIMPFAAEAYLSEHGMPASLNDAVRHHLVWQRAGQVATDALSLMPNADAVRAMIVWETNTSSAHYWAVAHGAGIGLLPTYVGAIDTQIKPVDVGVQLRRDIYLVHHRAMRRSPAIDQAIACLRDAFDPVRYPWFADSFVHPDAFDRGVVDPGATGRVAALTSA